MDSTVDFYSSNAERLAQGYEKLSSETVHQAWTRFLPAAKSLILDVGAGSGRDAAWLADKGHDVVAVEPAQGMIELGHKLHPSPTITWLQDTLPALKEVHRLNLTFDLILLSAVWMHVAPTERERAFRKLARLLKPGGRLVIALRHGPSPDNRAMHPVSAAELRQLAKRFALEVVLEQEGPDQMGRPEVRWTTVVLWLPDDGTGALPLLRHVIINDAKSSTYKLALLRVLCRIADGAPGAVLEENEDTVVLPFGLVALYWLRTFRTLILDKRCLQQPAGARPSFAKASFQRLADLSPYDLRIGAHFQAERAQHVAEALRDARNTIKNMPAFFITYPNSKAPVFPCTSRSVRTGTDLRLDLDFLASFGTFSVPRTLWEAMSHYACWIEPAIVNEWCALMGRYEEKAGRPRTLDEYYGALRWLDEEHDTVLVRQLAADLQEHGRPIHCVWTGQRLRDKFHIDHCFPFAHWPNNDLWNLLPAHPKVNSSKSDRIPSAELLDQAHDRIVAWWETAYAATPYRERFAQEALAALPGVRGASQAVSVDTVWAGVRCQRLRLRSDQQLVQWNGLAAT